MRYKIDVLIKFSSPKDRLFEFGKHFLNVINSNGVLITLQKPISSVLNVYLQVITLLRHPPEDGEQNAKLHEDLANLIFAKQLAVKYLAIGRLALTIVMLGPLTYARVTD